MVAVVRFVLGAVGWVALKVVGGEDWVEAWNRSRRFKRVANEAHWRAAEAEAGGSVGSVEWFENNHLRLMYIITTGELSPDQLKRVLRGDELGHIWLDGVRTRVKRLANSRNLSDDVSDVFGALAAVANEDEACVWWAEHIEAKLTALVGKLDIAPGKNPTMEGPDKILALPKEFPDPPQPVRSWPVRSWWLELAQSMATWYAAQGQIDDWRDVCQAVQRGATPEMRGSRGWVHEELAAIARLKGDLPAARAELRMADRYRGSRGKAQHRHNDALIRFDLRRLDPGEVERAEESLKLAGRLRYRRDETGHALTGLAQSAVDISCAETLSGNAASEKMDRAAAALERSAQCFDQESQLRALAATKTNLVLTHWFNNDSQQARTTGEEALAIYNKLHEHLGRDDRLGRATLLLNLGAVLVQGSGADVGEGKKYLVTGVDLWKQLSDELPRNKNVTQGLGRTYLYLGDAADRQGGDRSEAKKHWQKAKNWCEEAGDAVGTAEAVRRPLHS